MDQERSQIARRLAQLGRQQTGQRGRLALAERGDTEHARQQAALELWQLDDRRVRGEAAELPRVRERLTQPAHLVDERVLLGLLPRPHPTLRDAVDAALGQLAAA